MRASHRCACAHTAQRDWKTRSRRHGEAFGGLAPQTKLQAPQIETWNTINQLSVCQFLECQAPPAQTQSPPQKREALY